jgi:predicted HD superfamily hydrolase involved in NAD metabolism
MPEAQSTFPNGNIPPTTGPEWEAQARSWAQARMSHDRFRHTQGVVEAATHLAERYRLPTTASLRLAGWIHDAAKEHSNAQLLALAGRLNYPIRPVEQHCPILLHGAVAALLAREDLDLDDPVVFTAAQYHTAGHPDMSDSDKVLYLADLIEPSRTYGWIDQVRRLVEDDLDRALLFAVTAKIRHLLRRGRVVDPRSLELHNKLLLAGVEFVLQEGD